jgi:hypothetical protein
MTRWGEELGAPRTWVNQLGESAPVLSRAVEVASPIDVLTPR